MTVAARQAGIVGVVTVILPIWGLSASNNSPSGAEGARLSPPKEEKQAVA
jgi:hypothetical protein